MARNIDNHKAALNSATDGVTACNALDALSKHAAKGSEDAKRALAEYARSGSIAHVRTFACASLAEVVKQADADFVKLFQDGLSDPELRYWSILGYLTVAGKSAYWELTKLALDPQIPLQERAQAIKCLAVSSKQTFDRRLDADPGHWTETDLRLSELQAWMEAGFPDGKGYPTPTQHPALNDPQSELEKIANRLDKKLERQRRVHQDSANATDWLSMADATDIQRISARWNLPCNYLDFLTRFSPINVTLENRKFYNHFQLFGAGELIEAQDGYSFDPVKQQPINEWPSHLVVIASHGGDPFVLDLSKSDGVDAPVDTALHGSGDWEFNREADTFLEFLAALAK